MDMNTLTTKRNENTVRPAGKCTGCGDDTTHAHECRICHVTTLCCVAIKCTFPADKLKTVTENFDDADLFKAREDKDTPGNIRKIADIVIRLSLAHGLRVNDVKRKVVSRLRDTCEGLDHDTPEMVAEYMAKIDGWLDLLKKKIWE
jgi:hypothetical protein